MKEIIIRDRQHPKFETNDVARTGIVIFKNKRRVDSIKFIDNLQFPDAVSLMANATLFLMKTYEKLGMSPSQVYDNFYQAMQQAFFQYQPDLSKELTEEEATKKIEAEKEKFIAHMKKSRPQPEGFETPKGVIDPYAR